MLWTVFVILVVLWAVGFITTYPLGGFIHILLAGALVILVIQVIQSHRAV
jgi:hypothetical protein